MSKNELTAKAFDYSLVDSDAKSKLIWFAGEIRKQAATHNETGLEIGKLLSDARDECGSKTAFESWVESECCYSIRSAYNYMAAYREFGSCATVAQIELGAMYALTSNEVAKKQALKLAAKGVTVTQAMAKKLVKDSKPKGKPGGAKPSSETTPAADGPASSATSKPRTGKIIPVPDYEDEAAADSESGDGPSQPSTSSPARGNTSESAAIEPGDKCPNCAGTKWIEDDSGWVCKKCNQPFGEATGGADDDQVKTLVSKTRKTAEALIRCFDDLNHVCPSPKHSEAIQWCKALLQLGREWK